jgi:hypothetical protein
MTEAEVLARVGNPDVTVGSKGTTSPRWSYMPAPGDPETTTMLQFNKGVVVDHRPQGRQEMMATRASAPAARIKPV